MKKYLCFIVTLLLSLFIHAQPGTSGMDVRFGVGPSFLGSGDMRAIMFENEWNIQLTPLLSTSLSIGYGRSDNGVWLSASFIQGNANLFLSPFGNKKRNDFRLGGGLSILKVSDVYIQSTGFNGQEFDVDHKFETRKTLGFTIAAENTYALTERFLIGIKVFGQSYGNSDSNTGILFKTGIIL